MAAQQQRTHKCPSSRVQSRPNNSNNEFALAYCVLGSQISKCPSLSCNTCGWNQSGFCRAALVGHKGRSGASSVASGHYSTLPLPRGRESQHGVDQGGAAGRKRCCSESVWWQKIRLCTLPVPGVHGSFVGRQCIRFVLCSRVNAPSLSPEDEFPLCP